jgi:hypothetical protein
MRFPPIILPVVSIDTDISFMVVFLVGAPDSLEMEQVEVHVRFHLLNELDGDVF